MWSEACALLERAERLHGQFFLLGHSSARQPSWQAPVDILESCDEIRVTVAIPGVNPDRVEVSLEAGYLLVVGERPLPNVSPATVVRRLEIPYGRFERRIDLTRSQLQVKRQRILNGCIELTLGKL